MMSVCEALLLWFASGIFATFLALLWDRRGQCQKSTVADTPDTDPREEKPDLDEFGPHETYRGP